MERRDFIRQMGGLVGGLAFGRLSWPSESLAAGPYEKCEKYKKLRLALLADAHLKDGAGHRPEAIALARAVAEINALSQGPDLVLFAGDLAHQGRPDALDLGREILSDLAAPLWAVRGEGDLGRGGTAPWVRRFGSPHFSRACQGAHVLGLDTVLVRTSHGAVFEIGDAQRLWLAQELARLDSATPLVIISHAPLAHLFLPWQQWTQDAAAIAPLLARFRQVLCLHGHGHNAVVSGQRSVASEKIPSGHPLAKGGITPGQLSAERECFESPPLKKGDLGGFSGGLTNYNKLLSFEWITENRKLKTENRLLSISLPATAWPAPQPIQGTPALVRPGLGPRGCGWVLVTLGPVNLDFRPHLWQA